MSAAAQPSSSDVASERVRLARAALGAALTVLGVRGADAGPTRMHFTAAGAERLEGVTCTAAPGGGYIVCLQLICDPLPLDRLAKQVRTAVSATAARAGVLPLLDSLEVHFSDLYTGAQRG